MSSPFPQCNSALERNSHAYGHQSIALRANRVLMVVILAAPHLLRRQALRLSLRRQEHKLRFRITLPKPLLLPQARAMQGP